MLLRVVSGVGRLIAAFAVLLFVPAGTLAWPQAWAFLAIFLVLIVLVAGFLMLKDPALLAERLQPGVHRGVSWDRRLSRIYSLLFLAWLVLMALDAVRFGWSNVPNWLNLTGAIGLILAGVLIFLVFRENTFLTSVVRIQSDREHHVIASGPYGYVRHPLYAAVLLLMPSAALLLGSWVGLAAVPLLGSLTVLRTLLEDRTLHADLEGYADYAARVTSRLVPGVW